jgi:hypothetical protein
MLRKVIRADGHIETKDVGTGFQSWNENIKARMGQIVYGVAEFEEVELWCDEEALLVDEPEQNFIATAIARQPIFGDVIVFQVGDIT